MKRWRVVQFPSTMAAEDYLNGLSIEPDQIRGMYAAAPTETASVVLVCWLTAHQQRIEQLHRAPRTADDLMPLDGEAPAMPFHPEEGGPGDSSHARPRRQRDEDAK